MIASDCNLNGPQARSIGMGECPLVLGECIQGQTREGRHFLITSPIGLFSWAEFVPNYVTLTVEPSDCWKALVAVKAYLAEQHLPECGHLRIVTPLRSGQGFGTSTADISAGLRAVAAAWHRAISPETIARIAIAIEPSDGSMFPGSVAFAHREGLLLEHLGPLPSFDALVLCTGGTVDTLEFDDVRQHFRYTQADIDKLVTAWNMVRRANQTRDATLLARACTISAQINERFLPKPFFKEISAFVACNGADGIMVAHSGTSLALIFDPRSPGFLQRMGEAEKTVSSLAIPTRFRISNHTILQKAALNQRFCGPDNRASISA